MGVPNPYRVRPLLGAKVAVNTSFSPLIHLHNPHSSTLQVLYHKKNWCNLEIVFDTVLLNCGCKITILCFIFSPISMFTKFILLKWYCVSGRTTVSAMNVLMHFP